MAKTDFLSFDTTASNNTDINNIGIQGTNSVNNFDDAFRTLMAILRRDLDNGVVYAAKSGSYTAVANDNNAILRFTASATLSLTAVATLGADWHVMVIADGGDVTIDPNSSETIDGATTLLIPNGRAVYIVSSGSAFFTDKSAASTTKGHIYGLTFSNDSGGDVTNDFITSAGSAASDDATPVLMTLPSAMTKRTDAAWAAGTGNGCWLDGASMPNGTGHTFLMRNPTSGAVDIGVSASVSPTLPAGYTQKRRIHSAVLRESAALVRVYQYGDLFRRAAPTNPDYTGTSARAAALLALSVPTGIVVAPIINVTLSVNGASGAQNFFGSANAGNIENQVQTQLSATADVATLSGVYLTNTSAQVYFRVDITAGSIALNQVSAIGWFDDRGRTQ